jgi:hypothetical protein
MAATMSSSSSNNTLTTVLLLTVAVTTTAAITHSLTRRSEERKVLKEKKSVYKRELMIKNKTLEARKLTGEPSGTMIDSVSIDKVYLWEVEDLKKRFSSSKKANVMQNFPKPSNYQANFYFPSVLTKTSSNISDKDGSAEPLEDKEDHSTNYNKLITNHECILGNIVRKPNMPTSTHAYVRAGPRRFLHFDPQVVNAAIVTCGGLCPGLNNVIRELTKTLSQSYAIGAKT